MLGDKVGRLYRAQHGRRVLAVFEFSQINSDGMAMQYLLMNFPRECAVPADGSGMGANNATFTRLKVYGMLADFEHPRINDPAQCKLQSAVNQFPASWTITDDNLDTITLSVVLLHRHRCFQRLMMDMRIANNFVQTEFARSGSRLAGD